MDVAGMEPANNRQCSRRTGEMHPNAAAGEFRRGEPKEFGQFPGNLKLLCQTVVTTVGYTGPINVRFRWRWFRDPHEFEMELVWACLLWSHRHFYDRGEFGDRFVNS